ncbi:uncharacterized protein I303_108310 [Kwoniella dejecticola CBS 10117]|uniref:Uncharacterized protein n=1 Tax=Kwoniella dejecticola CBS 10117 TaxID=1296121 RepID=A0A1A5ZXR2_9TREE|nr:uncharacterized protein I303_07363 [Kwoniella dejecticola CBS 10117]OBR82601.1 hypothetical protein I303_07363 [Kwoniella dejecticola CBS 10117]
MTEEPIMEGFKLSNLELQVLEYISFAGITITKPLLAGLLWEVNKGRRSKKKHKLRLDLVIRGEVRFDIDEGLVQLEKKQDEGLLRIIRSPAGVKTADEWREMLDKRQWHRK